MPTIVLDRVFQLTRWIVFNILVTCMIICGRQCPKKLNDACLCLLGTKRKFFQFPPANIHSYHPSTHICHRAIYLTRRHLIASWVLGFLTYTRYSASHNNTGSSVPHNTCYITARLKCFIFHNIGLVCFISNITWPLLTLFQFYYLLN